MSISLSNIWVVREIQISSTIIFIQPYKKPSQNQRSKDTQKLKVNGNMLKDGEVNANEMKMKTWDNGNNDTKTLESLSLSPAQPSAFDLLETRRQVQKCWVDGPILVVRKHHTPIIMHALPHKAAINRNLLNSSMSDISRERDSLNQAGNFTKI